MKAHCFINQPAGLSTQNIHQNINTNKTLGPTDIINPTTAVISVHKQKNPHIRLITGFIATTIVFLKYFYIRKGYFFRFIVLHVCMDVVGHAL